LVKWYLNINSKGESCCIKSKWKNNKREIKNKAKKQNKEEIKKSFYLLQNQGANFASRVNAQYLSYDVFTMIPCHLIMIFMHLW
jgi:hypothetical protein